LKELIKIDCTCEAIIGDALKQDQLKFAYDCARAFYESPAKSRLFPIEESGKPAQEFILKEMLPRLTTFRSLVYMHDIDRRKKKDFEEAEKKRLEEEKNKPPAPEPDPNAEPAAEEKEEEKKEEEEEDPEVVAERIKEEKRVKQAEEDAKYGRYMLWEGIVPEQRYEEWKQAADKIDGINPHVIEDIQDYVILQSYKPETPEGKKELVEVAKNLEEERKQKLAAESEEIKTKTKVEIRLEKYRPDKRIWNYFIEKESPYFKPHKFRIDANPFGIYEDGRVEKLWDDIKALESHLKLFEEAKWTALVRYVYDVLDDDLKKDELAAQNAK